MQVDLTNDSVPELLTITDLANLLQLSTRTIYRYRSEGRLCAPISLRGRTTRWRKADVLDWIAKGCPPTSNDQE